MSQRAFARLVGTSQATICDIERGRVQINAADLAQYASLLDKPISFVFPPNGQFDTTRELESPSLLRQLPSTWQNWPVQEAQIHVGAYKKVEPYDRARVPEELNSVLAFEELETARLVRNLPDQYPTEEDIEEDQKFHFRCRAWRDAVDNRESSHSE